MNLDTCVPTDKFDEAAVARAACLGYPAINPILPDLLEWLQDINWPVAPGVAKLLSKAGAEIAPHINAVFKSDDGIWKYWVLTTLAEHLEGEVWALIEPEVVRLSRSPTPDDTAEEVDVVARECLDKRSENRES